MNKGLNRRFFLKCMGAVSLGFSGLRAWANNDSHLLLDLPSYGYGPLQDVEGEILRLPKGFSYKVIAESGTKMDDGFFLPGRADGMGVFEGNNGRVILIRNHENSPHNVEHSPFGGKNQLLDKLRKEKFFDHGFGKKPHIGGTTTSIYNEQKQIVEKVFLSLVGTSRNCAGGTTPWGSWITCEEDFRNPNEDNEEQHGYNFEVPATEHIKVKYPIPLREMGKFNHEAIAVDPRTGIIYQTEDRHEGLIYRFIPEKKDKLHEGGRLQALAFVWKDSMDTRHWTEHDTLKIGTQYAVKWIDLDNVDSETDDLRLRGFAKGAACFARAEGMWFGNGEIFFACTNGGRRKTGQIFRYIPSKYEGTRSEKTKDHYPHLELFAEPNNTELLRYCDNLTVAPWGDVVFCEDNSNPRIVGISPKGNFYQIAENIGFKSEFAGVCFSPSGKTLFVNIQEAGLTLAITGPWQNR